MRGNLATLADATGWADVVRGPIEPKIEDADFLGLAAAQLPVEPWSDTTWKAWTSGLAASGRKGRALFHPLRLALTALQGPGRLTIAWKAENASMPRRLHGKNASDKLSLCCSLSSPAPATRDVSKARARQGAPGFRTILIGE